MLKITSKSLLPQKVKFNLKYFKNPFCNTEKNLFKRSETVKFKTNFFLKKNNNFKKLGPILFISGPARNGNHLLLSMLDGHPELPDIPGEDVFLKEFFCKAKDNEKKLITKIKSLKKIEFILKMSGVNFDKWARIFYFKKKRNKKILHSGLQRENISPDIDYKDNFPKINYLDFKKFLKKNLLSINKSKTFLDLFKIYLKAFSLLTKKKKNLKYNYLYCNSGLRRELFYLLRETKNIICLCPIRRFESFYFSYSKSRFNTSKIRQKPLNELWEHWRHKTIDYLILKKNYPNKIIFIKFEDLVLNPKKIAKKICKRLKISYTNNMLQPTSLGEYVSNNSSYKLNKKEDKKGEILKFPLKRKFPKKILPQEYFDILKLVHKSSL